MTLLHAAAIGAGAILVLTILMSALRTVVLPSGGLTGITRFVFAAAHRVFIHHRDTRWNRRVRPLYAPAALVSLPFVWAMLVTLGFTGVFWGLSHGTFDDGSLGTAFVTSGSSLFTLGFLRPPTTGLVFITFIEATIGLGLVALLISYLPTIYAAFSSREKGAGLLRPMLGSPPSTAGFLQRMEFARTLNTDAVWTQLSQWFADIEQSHTSFPALCSFPPQSPKRSWVATAGTVLDTAAILLAAVDRNDERSGMKTAAFVIVLANGVPAFVHVGQAAGLPLDDPRELIEIGALVDEPPPAISIRRDEFDAVVATMAGMGLPLKADADATWRAFAWIRSTYDDALCGLAGLTGAAPAPWTTDRPATVGRPHFFGHRPLRITWPDKA